MQPQEPDPRLRTALGLHQAGRLDEAEATYRDILDTAPQQLDALELLGVLLGQTGRLDEAYDTLSRAAAARPGDASINYNLAECCRQLGRTDAAIDAFKTVLAGDPEHVDAAVGLTAILTERGALHEVIDICRATIVRVPSDARLLNQLGSALLDSANAGDAREPLEKAVALAPDFELARRNLAAVLIHLEELPQALELLGPLVRANPDSIDYLHLGAVALNQSGQYKRALPALERLLEREPDHLEAIGLLANVYRNLLEPEMAIECYQRAVALAPDSAKHWARWAEMLARLSRLEEAHDAWSRANGLDTNDENTVLVGAQLARRAGDADKAYHDISRLDLEALSERFRANVLFELGRICEATSRQDEAFQAFLDANRNRASTWKITNADAEHYPNSLKNLLAYFTDADAASRISAWGDTAPDDGLQTPYFVVGFPRSGTTLIERMLGAHPDVVATDELNMVEMMKNELVAHAGRDDAYPSALDELDAAGLRRLRQCYWDYFHEHHPDPVGDRRVVDKQPFNLDHLGLIYRAFPDAKVLVALRDPRDVCISCFATDFATNPATVQFLDFERTARAYATLMALWQRYREILPLTMFTYKYEDLVSAPRDVVGRIVEFFELPWHDDLLEGGHKSAGTYISTPSYSTVVEPINTRAVARWQGYADKLEPVLPLLQPFIDDFGYA